MIKLYEFPRCPYCRKVKIALHEKEIPYKSILVDLNRKEQRKPEFLKLNPNGKVPVLMDGKKVIYESTVINEYLEEKYSTNPLLPQNHYTRAKIRMLVDYCEKTFHTYVFGIYKELKLNKSSKTKKELILHNSKQLDAEFNYLNSLLCGNKFLAGRFSLADIAFLPRVLLLDYLGIEVKAEYKNLNNWITRLQNRKSSEIVLTGNL